MKKILKFAFVMIGFIFLSSCGLLKNINHDHVYDTYGFNEECHWKKCECGEYDAETVAYHIFERKVTKPATKEEEGILQLKCKQCGYTKEEPIEKLHSHLFPSEFVGDEQGHYHLCSCGEKSEYENHNFNESIVKEATLGVSGQKRLTCSLCDYSKVVDYEISQEKMNEYAANINVTIRDTLSKTLTDKQMYDELEVIYASYIHLNDTARQLVTNYQAMDEVMSEYEKTFDNDPQEVIDLVKKIGLIQDSKTTINNALALYEALPLRFKTEVYNGEALVAASQKLEEYIEIENLLKTTAGKKEVYTQAVLNTALAYFARGERIQYDQYNHRRNSGATPEDCCGDNWTFLDCSSFVNSVYTTAFASSTSGYTNTDPRKTNYDSVNTGVQITYSNTSNVDAIWYGQALSSAKDGWIPRADRNDEYAQTIKDMLKPGDLYVFRHGSSGHVMLYVGDILGDGEDYFIHCSGEAGSSSPSISSRGEEDQTYWEKDHGAILIENANVIFKEDDGYSQYTLVNRYMFNSEHTEWGIIRPIDRFAANPTKASLSDNGLARVLYPGLNLEKDNSIGNYHSAKKNTEITYIIKASNTGINDTGYCYIEEQIPTGATFVSCTENGWYDSTTNTIKWQLSNIKSNETKEIKYVLKFSGNISDTILDSKTYFNGMRLNMLANEIKSVDGDKIITEVNKLVGKTYSYTGQALVDAIKNAYGIDLKAKGQLGYPYNSGLSVGSKLVTGFMDTSTYKLKDDCPYEDLVPSIMYGGTKYRTENSGNKTRNNTMKNIFPEFLEPGDLICMYNGSNYYVYIYGSPTCIYGILDGKLEKAFSSESSVKQLVHKISYYNAFVIIRPTLSSYLG